MIIPWEDFLKVPINESKKLQWAKECIDCLRSNPDERMTYISSGDTMIMVCRVDEDLYTIEELKSQRWALYNDDEPNTTDISAESNPCHCLMSNLLKKGCQCGGN